MARIALRLRQHGDLLLEALGICRHGAVLRADKGGLIDRVMVRLLDGTALEQA